MRKLITVLCLSLLFAIVVFLVVFDLNSAFARVALEEEGVTFTPTFTATNTPTPTPTDTPTPTPTDTPTSTLPVQEFPTNTPTIADPTATPRPQPGGIGNSGIVSAIIIFIVLGIIFLTGVLIKSRSQNVK